MKQLLLILFFIPVLVFSQNEEIDLSDDFSAPTQLFQMHLKKPAAEIKLLQYDNSKETIEGEISDDGMAVVLKNYYKKGRVFVEILYRDGTTNAFSVGSCFIDPIFEL